MKTIDESERRRSRTNRGKRSIQNAPSLKAILRKVAKGADYRDALLGKPKKSGRKFTNRVKLRPEWTYNGRVLSRDLRLLFSDIDAFNRRYGHLHSRRYKTISHNSKRERVRLIKRAAMDLHKIGHPIQKLTGLTRKRLVALFRYWESEGRTATYMQNHACALRFVLKMTGRIEAFPEKPAEVLSDPTRWVRPRRTVEYTPEAVSADLDGAIAWLDDKDPVIGHMQRLKLEFGFRVQEAVMFRALEADRGDHLLITRQRGPKGGRPRCISLLDFTVDRVDTDTGTVYIRDVEVRRSAIELLEESKRLSALNRSANYPYGTLIPPERSKLQGMNYERALTRKAGMTKKALGCTSHSLRHAYAADRYERISGGLIRAYRRGERLPSAEEVAVDRAVRQMCAVWLGHNDSATTSVYTGPVTEIAPKNLKRVLAEALVGSIDEPFLRITHAGRAVPAKGRNIVVLNPDQVANFELLDRGKLSVD